MPESSEKKTQLLRRIELGICLTATLLAIWLHAVHLTHAGALWRDEAGGVQLATLPSVSETCRMLARDAFPVFFPGLVWVWSAVGLGGSDITLRMLGFLIGLSVLGAIWLNARLMGFRLPFISLGLLAANPTLLIWGDSLRAYGCGCLFILLTLGLVWRLVQAPGRASFLFATSAAILSVQTLYQNAFLVLAACAGGCVVCARHKDWRTAALVLGVGVAAAVSLLPYVPLILESQDWWILQKTGFEPDREFAVLSFALGSPPALLLWVWFGLIAIVLVAGWTTLQERPKTARVSSDQLPLFAASALIIGVVGFWVFVRISELLPQPWYFLPAMVFTVTATDAALANWPRVYRIAPLAFATLVFCVVFPSTLKFARCRQTNIDLLAAELKRRAKPGDFIVVFPWHCGITFKRYYQGQILWTTLPALADHRFHRFDLLKEKLCETSPIKPVLEQASRTLAAGHSLWIAGGLPPPAPGETQPPDPPPAPLPDQPYGWRVGIYTYAWGRQLDHLVADHAELVEVVSVNPEICVNPYEKLPLVMVTGWRGEPGMRSVPQ